MLPRQCLDGDVIAVYLEPSDRHTENDTYVMAKWLKMTENEAHSLPF
jgi:hypothetical protein